MPIFILFVSAGVLFDGAFFLWASLNDFYLKHLKKLFNALERVFHTNIIVYCQQNRHARFAIYTGSFTLIIWKVDNFAFTISYIFYISANR